MSLKQALFAILVVSCAASEVPAASAEEAAAMLKADGISVSGNPQKGYDVRFPRGRDHATPDQLKQVTELRKVVRIELHNIPNEAAAALAPIAEGVEWFEASFSELDDRGIAHVAAFKNVSKIGMRTDQKNPGPAITGEGMRQLRGFGKVQAVGVGGHAFPAKALALLPELFPNATKVDFNHTFLVNADVLTAFQSFRNLESLDLGGCYQFDEATMRSLGGLKNLKTLNIFHAAEAYQWAALESLRNHPNLERLQVGDRSDSGKERRIQDSDLEHLLTIPTLRTFSTGDDSRGNLTDGCAAVLSRHSNLRSIRLSRPEFSDQVLVALKEAPALDELTLEFDQHTREGLRLLANFRALETVRIGGYRRGTPMDDAKLDALHGIPALKKMEVYLSADSTTTEAAATRLKEAYPEADVQVRPGLDHRE